MLQQGIIEAAVSRWTSNVVLVKKKDGSLRFSIDYRHLNEASQKDAYPLPRIDTYFDAMNGARWFSMFDLRSGYHQVMMDDECGQDRQDNLHHQIRNNSIPRDAHM